MLQLFPVIVLTFLLVSLKAQSEDVYILQQSIKEFGPPQNLNYENFTFLGPGVLVDDLKNSTGNFFYHTSENYTIKIRSKKKHFSYCSHYEVGEVIENGDEKNFLVKGQFTEIIKRKKRGYFLRTVGFISDEKGYRRFLLDISTVTSE